MVDRFLVRRDEILLALVAVFPDGQTVVWSRHGRPTAQLSVCTDLEEVRRRFNPAELVPLV